MRFRNIILLLCKENPTNPKSLSFTGKTNNMASWATSTLPLSKSMAKLTLPMNITFSPRSLRAKRWKTSSSRPRLRLMLSGWEDKPTPPWGRIGSKWKSSSCMTDSSSNSLNMKSSERCFWIQKTANWSSILTMTSTGLTEETVLERIDWEYSWWSFEMNSGAEEKMV